jgi:protein-S-isoprenylcysteine O-methyltransferase Ste14
MGFPSVATIYLDQEAKCMKANSKQQEIPMNTTVLTILLVLGVLCVSTLIMLLSIQPVGSAVVKVIFIYTMGFLGAGLLIVALVNRLVDHRTSENGEST